MQHKTVQKRKIYINLNKLSPRSIPGKFPELRTRQTMLWWIFIDMNLPLIKPNHPSCKYIYVSSTCNSNMEITSATGFIAMVNYLVTKYTRIFAILICNCQLHRYESVLYGTACILSKVLYGKHRNPCLNLHLFAYTIFHVQTKPSMSVWFVYSRR